MNTLKGTDGGPHTGTTIVAVAYDGGVVLGADSRVSTGTYVSNRASNKITSLCDKVFLCRSGSAAHTEAISDYVRFYTSQHASEIGQGKEPTVKSVASILKQMSYSNKGLMAAMIVAGYDKKMGGQVFGSPIGGTMVEMPWAIEGSGSTYIWSFFDDEYKEGMSREETERLVLEGIAHAMARDGSSGGLVRLVTVDKDGAKSQVFQGKDVPMILGDMAEPKSNAATVVW
ncbi:beta type subunit of proteasome [Chloropicon primus]|uniref:proteasome endopeptidase complex n=1 Tax=Chloropicon primus TaxID=1764295 RepID=A0A5B8MCZ2_9CHLO|nr:beta type subunit of proteasome [Chloropicon primus]UPQ97617.1 beta type subunit of proteasome [Chloropicon primus]|mmetsp:Transcript_5726/g.17324  ORF Transcript_5726/g.17324 Transcript_5726/m.17324 type:complete len:229 (-) Transcript_5726:1254-1940(-)|eukprot:QDZ18406.1 beta type subunit of proteasome [Chloropicon primus]